MATLITGAGMVGCHAAALLVDRGEGVVLFDVAPVESYIGSVVDMNKITLIRGDILNLPDLMSAIQTNHVDRIIHTAALLGAAVQAKPYTAVKVNVEGTANVMEAARLAGVRRVVYCDTMGVYNLEVETGRGIDESHPVGPTSLYGATKLAGEHVGIFYSDIYGTEFLSVRFAVAYGRGYWYGGSIYGRVLNELVEKPVRGQPATVRRVPPFVGLTEYIYVKDMARAAVMAWGAEKPPHRVFNIGTGQLHTLDDVVQAARQATPGAQITIEEGGPAGPSLATPRKAAYDLTRARTELGYEPAFDLAAGLRDYAAQVRATLGARA